MKRIFAMALAPVLLAAAGMAAGDTGAAGAKKQAIAPNGSQYSSTGSADYFTGSVRIDPLFSATRQMPVSGAYVTFEPGARSAWHTHPAGQTLVVTAGIGLTQEWGGPIQTIRPGDVIQCPAGVKHWHGASPYAAMTHMAITGDVNGKNVEWLEKVTDSQYRGK